MSAGGYSIVCRNCGAQCGWEESLKAAEDFARRYSCGNCCAVNLRIDHGPPLAPQEPTNG